LIGDISYIGIKAVIIEDNLLTVDISVIGREGGIIEDAVIGKEEIVAGERLGVRYSISVEVVSSS